MATPAAAPEAPAEMVIKLRGNKLIVDLDEPTRASIQELVDLTDFDTQVVIKTILHRGIQQTSDAARAYKEETESARSKFIDTVQAPAATPCPPETQEQPDQESFQDMQTEPRWEEEPAAA